MSGLFWSNVNTDPKRRFRFILQAGNIPVWTVKTASKPRVSIGTVEHQFLNHTFKYPGRVTWDNITMTLVDPVDPDLSFTFLQKLRRSGYDYPTSPNVRNTINKADATGPQGASWQNRSGSGHRCMPLAHSSSFAGAICFLSGSSRVSRGYR